MRNYPPEVHTFVERYVFNFLDSLRKSKEMEDRYRSLSYGVKRASTQELKSIAHKMTINLLSKIDNINQLGHFENDVLLREVLKEAVPNND